MAETSAIEWTDATWNPITGCTLVSEGCRNCYAATLAATRMKSHPSRAGLARMNAEGVAKFTGEVRLNPQWLDHPLRWKKPRMVFVCAHGDLFHESVPDAWIDQVFAVMALAPQHTFQVLTKRPERMRDYLAILSEDIAVAVRRLGEATVDMGYEDEAACALANWINGWSRWADLPDDGNPLNGTVPRWPLPNVWLGVSVEDQATADERIPLLLDTPAAIRWVSAEPLLGPVDLNAVWVRMPGGGQTLWNVLDKREAHDAALEGDVATSLDWIVVGGESGAHARPMHPDWARSLRDQCAAAGVPFLFKQWGEWLEIDGIKCRPAHLPKGVSTFARGPDVRWLKLDGTVLELNDRMARHCSVWGTDSLIKRVGKKAAGRLLDGRTHDAWPEVR